MKLSRNALLLALLTACYHTENSLSGDRNRFGAPPSLNPAEALSPFARAQSVLRQNCISCHHHARWGNYGENDFVAKKLVVPRDPPHSSLYNRLKGVAPDGDMPDEADPLSAEDVRAIKEWIDSLRVSGDSSTR